MKIERGKQRRLAGFLGVSPQIINDYLSGRRNASPRVARLLWQATGADPFIWLMPENVGARRAAVEVWKEIR